MGVENLPYIEKTFNLGRFRFGFTHNVVCILSDPYLERWILWLGIVTFRIHKFYRGDNDRVLHSHPWPFITFPFSPYREDYWTGWGISRRTVRSWRFHYRPASHRHIVRKITPGPFCTFMVHGWKTNEWGFWPKPTTFVHWRDWEEYRAKH